MQTYPAVNRKNLVLTSQNPIPPALYWAGAKETCRDLQSVRGSAQRFPINCGQVRRPCWALCRTKFCCGIVAKEAWGWGDPPARTEFLLFSGTSWKSWDTDPRGTVCLVLFGCTQGCLPNLLLSLLENVGSTQGRIFKDPSDEWGFLATPLLSGVCYDRNSISSFFVIQEKFLRAHRVAFNGEPMWGSFVELRRDRWVSVLDCSGSER